MSPTWYAINNSVSLEDVPDLAAIGIKIGRRSLEPVAVFRDPGTGRLLAEVGTIHVYRDGRVWIIPRSDCPDACLLGLVRTAVDCVERDLHRRDRWHYYRPTKTAPVGQWSSHSGLPTGRALTVRGPRRDAPTGRTTGRQDHLRTAPPARLTPLRRPQRAGPSSGASAGGLGASRRPQRASTVSHAAPGMGRTGRHRSNSPFTARTGGGQRPLAVVLVPPSDAHHQVGA